jgi:hypothetical protein
LLGGAGVTLGCGGAALYRRFISAALWGILTGLLYTTALMIVALQGEIIWGDAIVSGAWRVFIFTILATIGAMITELRLPDEEIKV